MFPAICSKTLCFVFFQCEQHDLIGMFLPECCMDIKEVFLVEKPALFAPLSPYPLINNLSMNFIATLPGAFDI